MIRDEMFHGVRHRVRQVLACSRQQVGQFAVGVVKLMRQDVVRDVCIGVRLRIRVEFRADTPAKLPTFVVLRKVGVRIGCVGTAKVQLEPLVQRMRCATPLVPPHLVPPEVRGDIAGVLEQFGIGRRRGWNVLIVLRSQKRRIPGTLQVTGCVDSVLIPNRIPPRQQRRPRRRPPGLHVTAGKNQPFPVHSEQCRRFVEIAPVAQVDTSAVCVRPAEVIHAEKDNVEIGG